LAALAHLLGERAAQAGDRDRKPSQFRPRAKSVICLFQHGGPSQVDLFDPKPALQKWHGQPYPAGEIEVHFDKERGNVLASPFAFRKCGESGIEISELLPHTAGIADEITLIRSMTTETIEHESALRVMHTGRRQAGYPTWGAWTLYGLGAEARDLPGYLVLSDPGGLPVDGARNWSSGWLPGSYQGTALRTADAVPIVHLQTPADVPAPARQSQLQFLEALNRRHLAQRPDNADLAVRLANFELAARMQTAVPGVLDISGETQATHQLYGLDRVECAEYGKRCLLARRLVEKGVRFVQLFLHEHPWDTHQNHHAESQRLCKMTDQPAAALVRDLKQRGLLDETIVIWAGEFGRLPISQGSDGRDHNRHGFSLWIAGGGFRPGYVHGTTDEFGYRAVEHVVTVHDLHATLLESLGLDHLDLTFPRAGRPATLTDAEVTKARVIPELLA
jgi:hypothetical protein